MLSLKISLSHCVGDQPLSFSSPLSLSPGRPFVCVCALLRSSPLTRARRSFVASSAESFPFFLALPAADEGRDAAH